MIIAGLDPGLGGAVARLSSTGGCATFDIPVLHLQRGGKSKREVDAYALVDLLRSLEADHLFLEQVGAMPRQGVSSTFAFGKGFGIVIGIIAALGIPMTLVPSAKWKRTLGVPAVKDATRYRASQLLPAAANVAPRQARGACGSRLVGPLWAPRVRP